MSDEINRNLDEATDQPQNLNMAYMNRLFATTKERVSYILYKAYGSTTLGRFDVGSEVWLYDMYGVKPHKPCESTGHTDRL